MRKINISSGAQELKRLKAGQQVLLSGIIYTARDQAHKRLAEAMNKHRKTPLDLKGRIIYYCGPTKTPKGKIIGTSTSLECHGERPSTTLRTSLSERSESNGRSRTIGSCGPTTSFRMDEFTPALLKKGVLAMIGKGRRSQRVIQAIKKHRAVYFLTYSGCGALLNKFVKNAKIVAYKDLGPEAIYKLEVRDFPLIVGIDARGNDIYKKASTTIK